MGGSYFYLSYARETEDVFVERFFEDLSRAVREKAGLARDEAVGFFEPEVLKPGHAWEVEVVEALQSCQTMVCLYSPAYFKSENCGKEWMVFSMRRRLYAEREMARRGDPDVGWLPSLKPVLWIPQPTGEIPGIATSERYRYVVGDWKAPHNEIGVKDMIRRWVQYQDNYRVYVDLLASDVLATCLKFKLPPLDIFPPLDEVPSAFGQPAAVVPTLAEVAIPVVKPAGAGASSTGVFISYRRNEAAAYAGRLYDRLAARFGRGRVFIDTENVGWGEDFVEVITAAASSCAAMIVLISREWTRGAQVEVDDYVRLEVATALERKIRVIPILIQGATMPAPKDLPEDLSPLVRRNALALSDTRWERDVEDLIETLEGLLKD
ncbi:MAG: toll/interleukin-1 receptor domain-containing protein [Pyrinomonadaceae bacterium]